MKTCKVCQIEKSFTEFYANKKTGYFISYCKPCAYIKSKNWVLANPDKVAALQAKYKSEREPKIPKEQPPPKINKALIRSFKINGHSICDLRKGSWLEYMRKKDMLSIEREKEIKRENRNASAISSRKAQKIKVFKQNTEMCIKRLFKKERREMTKKWISAKAAEKLAFVENYLKNHPCVDCKESDHIVLEFDHVRGVKVMDISKMKRKGYSFELLEAEIAKCEVRCCNCHRKITYRRRVEKL